MGDRPTLKLSTEHDSVGCFVLVVADAGRFRTQLAEDDVITVDDPAAEEATGGCATSWVNKAILSLTLRSLRSSRPPWVCEVRQTAEPVPPALPLRPRATDGATDTFVVVVAAAVVVLVSSM